MSTDSEGPGTAGMFFPNHQKHPQHPPMFMQGLNSSLEDKDSDFLCPVCFETIEEAHVTRCGHTFCFKCIMRSIESLGKCPKCNINITQQDIFPNFLLNELVAKYKAQGKGMDSGRTSVIFNSSGRVTDCTNLSLPDVNAMLKVLTTHKQLLEAESCAAQNKLLFEFLKHLLQQKEDQRNRLERELSIIKDDLKEVEVILQNLQRTCSQFEDSNKKQQQSTDHLHQDSVEQVEIKQEMINLINTIDATVDKNLTCGQKNIKNTSTLSLRRKRMHAHFEDFVQCYFSARANELHFGKSQETTSNTRRTGLDVFREDLVKFSRYNSLRPLATLNYSSDIFNHSTIVSSIEFDKDNEFFAIAGVTKRIKVFDYNTVIRGSVDLHYPSVEMTSSSKISCVSWNSFHKGVLASSDYEGTVTIWDAMTGQRTKAFHEHEKRCWSIDFNDVDTRLIASGSDDARVKLWSLNMDHSIASLEAKANVCCVKFNPKSSCHLAFGSADHCVHYYDLRNMKEALCVFKGHKKAVSYVKFFNEREIVSASTDSQLKMWNISNPNCLRSFVGHINEKNFVGLATDGDYVACGSENNALYLYYKGLTKQLFSYKFDAAKSILETQEKREEDLNEFVSAVCWRQSSNVVVAANSQGIIKVLELI